MTQHNEAGGTVGTLTAPDCLLRGQTRRRRYKEAGGDVTAGDGTHDGDGSVAMGTLMRRKASLPFAQHLFQFQSCTFI